MWCKELREILAFLLCLGNKRWITWALCNGGCYKLLNSPAHKRYQKLENNNPQYCRLKVTSCFSRDNAVNTNIEVSSSKQLVGDWDHHFKGMSGLEGIAVLELKGQIKILVMSLHLVKNCHGHFFIDYILVLCIVNTLAFAFKGFILLQQIQWYSTSF
jgi:hypothetical protein